MSLDWDKYSTAEQTRNRGRKPHHNAVVSLMVGGIRTINNLEVLHTPEKENQAHSESVLPEDETLTEIRVLLLRLAKMEIPLASTD